MTTYLLAMQNRTDILKSVKVALSTKDSIQVVWSVFDDQTAIVRGFKIRYQAIGSNVVQFSGMLGSSTYSHEITRLHENTAYDVCVHVFTADQIQQQQPVYTIRDIDSPSAGHQLTTGCVAGSTAIDALRVAVGSTLGAFIALGVVVGFVLIAKCQAGRQIARQRRRVRVETHCRRRPNDVIHRDGRCRLVSTESDELSINDDDSHAACDDKQRLPVGHVEKKAVPIMVAFDGRKFSRIGRYAETGVFVAHGTWPTEYSSVSSRDDILSFKTRPTAVMINEVERGLFPVIRTLQFDMRNQSQLSPVTDRSPGDSSISSSLNRYSMSIVQPQIDTQPVSDTGNKIDGGLVREGTPSSYAFLDDNIIPPQPPSRVMLMSDVHSGFSSTRDEISIGIDGELGEKSVGGWREPESLMLSSADDQRALLSTVVIRSRHNSSTRDDITKVSQMPFPDDSAHEMWVRLTESQRLLPVPVSKTIGNVDSLSGRSFPNLTAFDGGSSSQGIPKYYETKPPPQRRINVSPINLSLNVPTFVRNIPAFNAHQTDDLESPPSSDWLVDDTVQLLTAEGAVGMKRGNIDEFEDRLQQQHEPRPSQATLRPNHSSIW